MSAGSHLDGVFVSRGTVRIRVHHIGEQERGAFLFYGIGQEPERSADVGAGGFGFQFNDFPDDAEEMAASLAGRYEFLYLVAEEQGSDLVIVDDGGE